MSRLGTNISKMAKEFFDEDNVVSIKGDCTKIISKQAFDGVLNNINNRAFEDEELIPATGLLFCILQYLKNDICIEALEGCIRDVNEQRTDTTQRTDSKLLQAVEEILTLPLLFASCRQFRKDNTVAVRQFNAQLCDILEILIEKTKLSTEIVWCYVPSFYETISLESSLGDSLDIAEYNQYIKDYLQIIDQNYPYEETQGSFLSCLKSNYSQK